MFDKMKQLMEMKKQAEKIKKDLDASSVDVDDGKGVKITINGAQNIQSIEIADSLLNSGNKVKIENTILRSINIAISKSQEMAARKMKAVMPAFPGM